MIKKILVIGGAGFLGKAIAQRFLIDQSFDITIGDLNEPQVPIKFIRLNILDKTCVEKSIKNYDIIINCTGQATKPITTCFDINTKGIKNLADTVKTEEKKIIHISSVALYGTCNYADESNPLNPETPYATCKAFAEFILESTLNKESFNILRLPNLYGTNQSTGLFAYLKKSYSSDRHLSFDNDGSMLRYFLYINDSVEAIYLSVKNNLIGIFNIPVVEKYCLSEVIEIIENIYKMKFTTTFSKNKPSENINLINFNSFFNATEFKPQIRLTDYLKKAFA